VTRKQEKVTIKKLNSLNKHFAKKYPEKKIYYESWDYELKAFLKYFFNKDRENCERSWSLSRGPFLG